MNAKEPVRLRLRKQKSGLTSLYLDIYYNKVRSYEYLRLYLVEEHTRQDREKNRQTLMLAEAIRAKRVVELRNNRYGFKTRSDIGFFDYFNYTIDIKEKTNSQANIKTWLSCLHHLHEYEHRNIRLDEVTDRWLTGFRLYLENNVGAYSIVSKSAKKNAALKKSTCHIYLSKVRCCLNMAVKDGLIDRNPMRYNGTPGNDSTRMYLTIDELRRLSSTPCSNECVKSAFLFSCLTGLRRSDIETLCWGDVYQQGEYTRIIFRQKKTKRQEYLDITPQASALMGERQAADKRIFQIMHYPAYANRVIENWVRDAGIGKKITFHCARHTFATMMLDIGTDIYIVSRLLGHTEVSTTQIYAKVMDKNKQAAVSRIPDIICDRDAE